MSTEEAAQERYPGPRELAYPQVIIQVNAGIIKSFYVRYVKRALDLVIAIIGLVFALPIILVSAVLVVAETSGPVIYLQERVGLGGKPFRVIKLRSMVANAEKDGAQWAVKNDSRITKVGSFIRKTRIDELPQLINVIKGEMSMIGPRPERAFFTYQFNSEIPGFIDRLRVKPGLTGWAQVNGGYEITPKQKLALDLEYIENLSWRMELLILLKTVKVITNGEGAR
jgi:lipopolysaccharide/colanic/teichoic acid biosynthesis glycosyltransferase